MILGSCYSFQGKSHKVSNTICQDASVVKVIVGDWTVMATADGVGSCPKSDIGSKTAVETASELCLQAFPVDGSDTAILALLRTAFNRAMRAVSQTAKEAGDDITLYDTTLDIVIFNGSSKLYYGHCGDGGIFVLNGDGDYKEITTVQEGEEASSVIPLRNGNSSWEFGIYEDEIAIVAAFTDGIRDKISPPLLCNEVCKIDVPLANKFMFVDVYDMSESETIETLKQSMQSSATYLHSADCNITDDMTMSILVNTSVLVREDPAERYEKPNWAKIWHDVIERLYPNPDSVNQVFRRHKLQEYIIKNPDKYDATDKQLEQLLDIYYPLTPAETEQYTIKYGKKETTASPESSSEHDLTPDTQKKTLKETETIPKDEESIPEKIRASFEVLIDDIKTKLSINQKTQTSESDNDTNKHDDIPDTQTEDEIVSDFRQNVNAEDLDIPIFDSVTQLSYDSDLSALSGQEDSK